MKKQTIAEAVKEAMLDNTARLPVNENNIKIRVAGAKQGKKFPRVLLASKKQSWQTPKESFFDKLKVPFAIKLDPCTSSDNPLGTKYFITKQQDALTKPWFYNAFINPPYDMTKEFLIKTICEHQLNKTINVFLCASRTDTEAMQRIGFPNARAICFIKGRLKFGGSENTATFPSCILVFGARALTKPQAEVLQGFGYTIEQ